MARPKQPPAEDKEPATSGLLPSQQETPKQQAHVVVGDTVLFIQPAAMITHGLREHVKIPMMVTRVHNDGRTIDGIVFSANGNVAFTGTRDVYDVKHGNSITNWTHKDARSE